MVIVIIVISLVIEFITFFEVYFIFHWLRIGFCGSIWNPLVLGIWYHLSHTFVQWRIIEGLWNLVWLWNWCCRSFRMWNTWDHVRNLWILLWLKWSRFCLIIHNLLNLGFRRSRGILWNLWRLRWRLRSRIWMLSLFRWVDRVFLRFICFIAGKTWGVVGILVWGRLSFFR